MANSIRAQSAAGHVLPKPYLIAFMIVEPGVMLFGLIMLIASPSDHFHSLAPEDTMVGAFFKRDVTAPTCAFPAAWQTPQLRVLLYQLVAALAFSGVVEPLLLYAARYRMESARDAQTIVAMTLIAFTIFDIFHALSVLTVVGVERVIPSLSLGWSNIDLYAAINVWVPVAWMIVRSLWFLGVGRLIIKKKVD